MAHNDTIGHVGSYAVCLAAVLVNVIVSAIWVRKRKDWTRRGFLWHYVPMAQFWLFLLIAIASELVSSKQRPDTTGFGSTPVQFNLALFTTAIRQGADVMFYVVILLLISGFRTTLSSGETNVVFRLTHLSIFVFQGLYCLINVALGELVVADLNDGLFPQSSSRTHSIATSAWEILAFAVSIELLIWTLYVLIRAFFTRHAGFLWSRAVLLVAIATINVCRSISIFVVALIQLCMPTQTQSATDALANAIYSWLTVVMSSLIIALGMRKVWLTVPWESSFRLAQDRDLSTGSPLPYADGDCYQMQRLRSTPDLPLSGAPKRG